MSATGTTPSLVAGRPGVRSIPLTRTVPVAAAGAAVVNLGLLALGHAIGAAMVADGNALSPFAVVIATLIGLALGVVPLVLVARGRPRRVRALAGVGLAVGVVTVALPLLLVADGATAAVLAAMHVAAGAAWFVALRLSSRAD